MPILSAQPGKVGVIGTTASNVFCTKWACESFSFGEAPSMTDISYIRRASRREYDHVIPVMLGMKNKCVCEEVMHIFSLPIARTGE